MENKFYFYLIVLFSIIIYGCAQKQSTNLMGNMEIKEGINKDLEFKKMCLNAGYEWMYMKPTQDGKIIQSSQ